jgi:hypothetical protein
LQQKYFANAEVGLDWIHVTEKLWMAGQCLFAEGSAEPDFEGIWLFWKHDLNDFDHLAASKAQKA